MTITKIYIKYTQYKLYICYPSHSILSSHYSLQRLELLRVRMTSDSVLHFAHYIRKASQLKKLELVRVCDRVERYVHN